MPLDDIKNFLPIDARIGTAGQPTEDELREVAADGYRAVVNLGLLNPEYCLPDEAGLVASLGLQYRHIPVNFDAPAIADFEAFVAQMDAWSGERVFVHCAANFRVSSFMLHVHTKGIGVAGVYPYEVAETKAHQVVQFARENEMPLQASLRKSQEQS